VACCVSRCACTAWVTLYLRCDVQRRSGERVRASW
jgi:hypothetical protein